MKKKSLILLICLILTGCGYDKYKMPEGVSIEIKNDKIEIYDDTKLYDLFTLNNAKIITKNKTINTNKLGKYESEIKYKYNNKTYKYILNYQIVDTTAPVYIQAASTLSVLTNNDIYPCENIVYADNYDRNPTCEIVGDYDLTTGGSYKVKYVITDSSNNKNEKNLTIKVIENYTSPKKSSNETKQNLLFSDVLKQYKNKNTMIGIDVSKWQGNIDFNKVKEAGCEFVIMRIGVNSDIDKDLSIDSYYKENIKKAKEAGLKVGVYVYTSAINKKTALEHAKWVINTLDGEKLDFPIAFDWENWSKLMNYQISIHDLDETFDNFYKYCKEKGYEAMLYSSKYYLENVWTNKNNYPVWLAHYKNKTDYKGNYILWQMSNIGKIDGITENVDIDIYYKK